MFRKFSSRGYRFGSLYSQSAYYGSPRYRNGLKSTSAVVAATLLWYSTTKVVHGDAPTETDRILNVVVWGSNKCVATITILNQDEMVLMVFTGQT